MIGIVVAAVLAVLITAVILWVVRKRRVGEFSEFTGITTNPHLYISDLKDLQTGTSLSVLSQAFIKMRCSICDVIKRLA